MIHLPIFWSALALKIVNTLGPLQTGMIQSPNYWSMGHDADNPVVLSITHFSLIDKCLGFNGTKPPSLLSQAP